MPLFIIYKVSAKETRSKDRRALFFQIEITVKIENNTHSSESHQGSLASELRPPVFK